MKRRLFGIALAIGLLNFVQQSLAQQNYFVPFDSVSYTDDYSYSDSNTDQAKGGEEAPAASCADGQCESSESCDGALYCVDPCYQPRWTFFGDFLYLRARDVEVPYAVAIDGPSDDWFAPVNQVGRVALVDSDYEPGFRIGGSFQLDCDAALAAQYTWWRSDSEDDVTAPETRVLRSLVGHPGPHNVSHDGLDAVAAYDIQFQIADVDYRGSLFCNGRTSLTWLAGVSYVNLEEDFASEFGVNGLSFVESNIEFNGGGLRLGLEAERYARDCGLMVYGRSSARFVAGEFNADYFEGQLPGDPDQIDTGWEAGRVVTILDLELGVGWTSCDGCWRFSGGYLVSGWFNTVSTADWIAGVQQNDYRDLDDTITFDGFTARAEIRY